MAIKVITAKSNYRDYLIDLNDLGLPKVVDMNDITSGKFNPAILAIIRLLIMRKGTDPDRPNMGIDITARYRFAFDSELSTLANELQEQLAIYLPESLPIQVQTDFVSETLADKIVNRVQISISMDDITYQLLYNKDDGILELS